MGATKSKGERLNWPLLNDSKHVNSKAMLMEVKGRVLSEDDSRQRKGSIATFLVP